MTEPQILWYEQPAQEAITEGLPLGNGHLGLLVLGDPAHERLVLNESTLFDGGPYSPANPASRDSLGKVRELIFQGDFRLAAMVAESTMMGQPKKQLPYQPLGDLYLDFPRHENYSQYRRELNLETAIASTCYVAFGVEFTRELFVSYADKVLVARFACSTPGALSCVLRLSSEQRGLYDWQDDAERAYGVERLVMRGRNREKRGIEGALRFEFAADLRLEGGRALPGEDSLSVRSATSLVLVGAAATNYRRYNDLSQDPRAVVEERLARAATLTYEELRARHVDEYAALYGRFHIDLGTVTTQALKPTDQRIVEFQRGQDPALCALYVQYARYLTLACSRPSSQPSNLQGIWNDKRRPPWGGKYTININTEMNYWPAHPGNLAECTEPLFALVEDLAETGSLTAKVQYGARGFVVHHNTDLWRATAPVDGVEWGLWPTGGAWLCLHLWEHYQFTRSLPHLERAYPLLKGAAEFFVDSLVIDPKSHFLVTCPSISPENQHPHGSAVCAGPAMDMAILRDLFSATIEAAKILNRDPAFCDVLAEKRAMLAPYRVGKAGQLMEWQDDWDLEAPEPHHRHVSHLFGLHPSCQISPHKTPELAAAAKKTLELRGDFATGWSLAWKVNFWARLGDAERAYQLLCLLLHPERSYTNLFDAHPPFQIDGNFGGAAGILEMLIQSEPGRIHLLPALPRAWPKGTVRGVRARGAISVDFAWESAHITSASFRSSVDQEVWLVLHSSNPVKLSFTAGEVVALERSDIGCNQGVQSPP